MTQKRSETIVTKATLNYPELLAMIKRDEVKARIILKKGLGGGEKSDQEDKITIKTIKEKRKPELKVTKSLVPKSQTLGRISKLRANIDIVQNQTAILKTEAVKSKSNHKEVKKVKIKLARSKSVIDNYHCSEYPYESVQIIKKKVLDLIEIFQTTGKRPKDESLNKFSKNIFQNNNKGEDRGRVLKLKIGDKLFDEFQYWYFFTTEEYSHILRGFEIANNLEGKENRNDLTRSQREWLMSLFKPGIDGIRRKQKIRKLLGREHFNHLISLYYNTSQHSDLIRFLNKMKIYMETENRRPTIATKEYTRLYAVLNYDKRIFGELKKGDLILANEVGELWDNLRKYKRLNNKK